jgi:flagellar P-ring protein precursor FlgI
MRLPFLRAAVFLLATLVMVGSGQAASRIKDIVSVQSARDNQLIGYGLVVGLQGTGDGLRNSPFTDQSLRAMLENLGISTQGGATNANNVAAVLVTATLPPFASRGSRVDVTVSSLGDATSLRGGTLVMTSLSGADGQVYAVAQGGVIVSGFQAEGAAQQLTQGITTTGRVPNGAIIEREVGADFEESGPLNRFTASRYGAPTARAKDSVEVVVAKPNAATLTRFMAEIEDLLVEPDTPARVVVNERTGTIVIGHDVQISKVAISYGTLTIRVNEAPRVVQPAPFSDGETAVEPSTEIYADVEGGQVAIIDGPNLQQLVAGLNSIGVKPDGIIAILQGIKSAGALQAELVLQ